MKLTLRQLKQIIKEELLRENEKKYDDEEERYDEEYAEEKFEDFKSDLIYAILAVDKIECENVLSWARGDGLSDQRLKDLWNEAWNSDEVQDVLKSHEGKGGSGRYPLLMKVKEHIDSWVNKSYKESFDSSLEEYYKDFKQMIEIGHSVQQLKNFIRKEIIRKFDPSPDELIDAFMDMADFDRPIRRSADVISDYFEEGAKINLDYLSKKADQALELALASRNFNNFIGVIMDLQQIGYNNNDIVYSIEI